MTDKEIMMIAKNEFEQYAAVSDPVELGFDRCMSSLQVELARWQTKNFGGGSPERIALGVAEEAGEICHALLKRTQGIRGMDDVDEFRTACGDAIADCAIYLTQLATALRLDFGALYELTARKVMERNWIADPDHGGEK